MIGNCNAVGRIDPRRIRIARTWRGHIVKEYDSIKAALRLDGFDPKPVRAVLNGEKEKAYGYGWIYLD